MQIVANNLGNALVPDLTANIEASDNRTPRHKLIFDQDPDAGSIVTVGTHTVTVTVTDLSGNTHSCTTELEVIALTTTEPVNILDPSEETVIELDAEAETNFDGSEVVLTWTFPSGVDTSGTVYIARDGELLATTTGTTYTDTTVESGEIYVYTITYIP